jgi:hypothetical protein
MNVSLYKLSAEHGNGPTIPYNSPGITDVNSKSEDYCRGQEKRLSAQLPNRFVVHVFDGLRNKQHGLLLSAFMR